MENKIIYGMPLQAMANAEAYKPLVAWVCEV